VVLRLRAQLAYAKFHLAQIIAVGLGWEQLADDALSSVARVAEEQHDRLAALGGAAAGCALVVRQLGQLGAQRGMQTAVEAGDDGSALVRRSAELVVARKRDARGRRSASRRGRPVPRRSVRRRPSAWARVLSDARARVQSRRPLLLGR
jgi:hypothetical protein